MMRVTDADRWDHLGHDDQLEQDSPHASEARRIGTGIDLGDIRRGPENRTCDIAEVCAEVVCKVSGELAEKGIEIGLLIVGRVSASMPGPSLRLVLLHLMMEGATRVGAGGLLRMTVTADEYWCRVMIECRRPGPETRASRTDSPDACVPNRAFLRRVAERYGGELGGFDMGRGSHTLVVAIPGRLSIPTARRPAHLG